MIHLRHPESMLCYYHYPVIRIGHNDGICDVVRVEILVEIPHLIRVFDDVIHDDCPVRTDKFASQEEVFQCRGLERIDENDVELHIARGPKEFRRV